MGNMIRLIEEIKHPSEEFTPIPFWFFNDVPDEERIAAQLRDYVEKGVNGIVLHPRIGVPESLPYLSEAYFEVVRFIVKTAAELKMKVVLYDEGMYPSGSAHGLVVAANPDYASKGIRLVERESEIPAEGEIITQFAEGNYLVYCFTHGTIRGIHFGEDDGEAGAPASADILNPAAVEEFIHLTHDRYYEALREYFGNTVIAFFTDEPCALGRNARGFREWVSGMEQELVAAGGRPEELEGLFTGEQNTTTELYHKLIKKHLREIFYAALSRWCEQHGIALMGHPEASDDVEEELYFHIPGQDLIMRRVSPETGGISEFDSVQAKLAADIARHLGRRRNANECFGVCFRNQIPWYFTGADMKWYIDWLGLRGVNLYVPHAFYYSVAGKRKEERPPDVGPNNIWWKHYRRFSDYMKRLSYLMTDSVNGARVAVLCDNNRVPYAEVAALYEQQIEFNYLPVTLLAQCCVKGGRLSIGEYQYDVVLNVLGAPYQQLPVGEDGSQVVVVNAPEALLQLRTVKTAQSCPNLRVSKLRKLDTDMYLFSNEGEQEISTCVEVPEAGTPILVDLWRAKCYKAQRQEGIPICLAPRETVLLILADATEAEAMELAQAQELSGDWTNRFTLQEKAENQAIYTYTHYAETVLGTESFQVRGEEMVECYCNGTLADVSFWGPHRFEIGTVLRKGENELKLVVTGNAANIYCEAEIAYGLA
ncbi:MAG: hypothetical protein IJY09_03185 [Lachnospiraceae bacterium]|nr:hypothetical protein [Lachnospiraceae bacterium]